MQYGSDIVIEFLRRAGVDYVALNPGASFRGLHDSLVHADTPRSITVVHEEIGIALAHGYAKSAGRPMAVFVHNLVGLLHATMAIFNAYADNAPMLIVGGSGPRNAAHRRPWIDWIHTTQQGVMVRDFVKWDDEPATLEAIPDSLARAWRIAQTPPMGPVYVAIDAELQEEAIGDRVIPIHILNPPEPVVAPASVINEVAAGIAAAKNPVIIVDRPGLGVTEPLVQLADALAPAVIDLDARGTFPSTHTSDQTADKTAVLSKADYVLALEVRDLAWGITTLDMNTRETVLLLQDDAKLVSVGLTETQHTGFLTREALVPQARYVTSDVGAFLHALNDMLGSDTLDDATIAARREMLQQQHLAHRENSHAEALETAKEKPIAPAHLALTLWETIKDDQWQLSNGVLFGLPRKLWDFEGAHSYIGRSGGEGLGYGLPASLGAALAQLDDETLVVDLQSDGDLMYVAGALWTAAHENLPLLIVVYNNRSYGKDEKHQKTVAKQRGHSFDKVPIGIHIDHPPVDFATLARAQGVEGIGPVEDPDALAGVLLEAKTIVQQQRRPVLVDVICRR